MEKEIRPGKWIKQCVHVTSHSWLYPDTFILAMSNTKIWVCFSTTTRRWQIGERSDQGAEWESGWGGGWPECIEELHKRIAKAMEGTVYAE